MSEAHKGEKAPNWKGGITPINKQIKNSIQYHLWRKVVFARDNWTCQKCGARNGNGKTIYLHPHHILNFAEHPELRFAIDNGITLCRKCHIEFHKRYGNRNNTKEQLEEFLNKSTS
jgi:5-methylcytosine-specific restriction endonuclease McrA